MIRINLFITVTTMIAGLIMFVPNFFGMNLISGLESRRGTFIQVTVTSSIGLVVLSLLAYRVLSVYAR